MSEFKVSNGEDSDFQEMTDLYTADMVDIYVGPLRRRYHIHRKILTDCSEFSKAALDNLDEIKDKTSAEVSLLEFEVESFDLFVNWMYARDAGRYKLNSISRNRLWSLLVLSGKLQAKKLHNDTIDAIIYSLRQEFVKEEVTVNMKEVTHVYDLPTGKKARFLICLLVVSQAWSSTYSEKPLLKEDLNKVLKEGGDFVTDFSRLVWDRPEEISSDIEDCKFLDKDMNHCFHDHPDRPSQWPSEWMRSAWSLFDEGVDH